MKNVRAPKPVVVAALTLLTVVAWIIFGVIRIIVKPEDVNVPNEILAPLDPSLNTQILTNLENRIFLSDEEIGEIIITPQPESTQTQTPVPESTESGELSPSPTQSPSSSPTQSPSPTP